jgi:hypothetical protein
MIFSPGEIEGNYSDLAARGMRAAFSNVLPIVLPLQSNP